MMGGWVRWGKKMRVMALFKGIGLGREGGGDMKGSQPAAELTPKSVDDNQDNQAISNQGKTLGELIAGV